MNQQAETQTPQTSQVSQLTEMLSSIVNGGKAKQAIKGVAKWITLAILIITFAVGVIGSFAWANFEMDKFTSFLPTFALFYVPLVVSIGASSVAKRVGENKEKEIEKIKEMEELTLSMRNQQ